MLLSRDNRPPGLESPGHRRYKVREEMAHGGRLDTCRFSYKNPKLFDFIPTCGRGGKKQKEKRNKNQHKDGFHLESDRSC